MAVVEQLRPVNTRPQDALLRHKGMARVDMRIGDARKAPQFAEGGGRVAALQGVAAAVPHSAALP